ncbi:hypothetical protein NIES2107_68930 (plasmid) [Nostoc carneum NIES-2107]|nr:hypothetical protein NIES2107_68930 [Nostoc carneum NIES-2107]
MTLLCPAIKKFLITNYELRITNYELRTTNYELVIPFSFVHKLLHTPQNFSE